MPEWLQFVLAVWALLGPGVGWMVLSCIEGADTSSPWWNRPDTSRSWEVWTGGSYDTIADDRLVIEVRKVASRGSRRHVLQRIKVASVRGDDGKFDTSVTEAVERAQSMVITLNSTGTR